MDPTCAASVHQQPIEHRATLPTGPDPKWRYFWRIGERPANTEFAELNAEPVIPAGNAQTCDLKLSACDGWKVQDFVKCITCKPARGSFNIGSIAAVGAICIGSPCHTPINTNAVQRGIRVVISLPNFLRLNGKACAHLSSYASLQGFIADVHDRIPRMACCNEWLGEQNACGPAHNSSARSSWARTSTECLDVPDGPRPTSPWANW